MTCTTFVDDTISEMNNYGNNVDKINSNDCKQQSDNQLITDNDDKQQSIH